MARASHSFAILAFCVLAAVLFAGGGVFCVERANRAREIQALDCARFLGLSALQYAHDHNDRYPDAGRWEQELTPYFEPGAGDILHPPAPWGGTPRRFSLNPAFSGKAMANAAESSNTWMFYESVSRTPSASDDLDHWPDPDHDGGRLFAVVYGDSHCYLRPPEWKQGIRQHLRGM